MAEQVSHYQFSSQHLPATGSVRRTVLQDHAASFRAVPPPVSQFKNGVIGSQWPTLAAAMSRYEQKTAELFVSEAYNAVMAGLIRLDDRRRLAKRAFELGIRPFDAQLLLACAIRQWVIDRRYDPTPRADAPKLSWEHQTWKKGWVRAALFMGTAVAVDTVLLWYWLAQ